MKTLDRVEAAVMAAISDGSDARDIARAALASIAEMDEAMFRYFFRQCCGIQPKIVNEMVRINAGRIGAPHPHEPGAITAHREFIEGIIGGGV